uniref:Uncharacterized protein n=1 Tax=Salix viminalis TaxID=40686 RepID=A0A6N2JWZ0_SALVM
MKLCMEKMINSGIQRLQGPPTAQGNFLVLWMKLCMEKMINSGFKAPGPPTAHAISDPWEHVVGMGLGVVFVNQLVKWDAQLEKDLDKMLQKAKEANERRYFDQDDD